MILKDNNPDDWRFYHDKCIRDMNVKTSDNDGAKKGKGKSKGSKDKRMLQETDDLADLKK